MEDLVSIIIPVYNVEEYLNACLSSACNQTYKNIEIIVIDDGSTDGSGKICDFFGNNDSRIKVVHQKNSGVSHSRNVGLNLARGKYISFIDGDDYIKNNMIELMISNIKSNYDLCVCNFNIDNDSNIKYKTFKINENLTLKDYCNQMLYGNSIEGVVWNRLYNKSILNDIRFNEDLYLLEDLVFNIEYLKKIKSVFYINEPLYYYRKRANSALRKGITEKSCNSIIAKWNIIKLLEDTNYRKSLFYQKINILCESEKLQKNFEVKKIEIKNLEYKNIIKDIKKYLPLVFFPSFFMIKSRVKFIIISLFPKIYMKRIKLNENK